MDYETTVKHNIVLSHTIYIEVNCVVECRGGTNVIYKKDFSKLQKLSV